jgi:hypothetical protein
MCAAVLHWNIRQVGIRSRDEGTLEIGRLIDGISRALLPLLRRHSVLGFGHFVEELPFSGLDNLYS